tara:strand:+ start:181 stop:807 length:627 start_codon:yes stop_codon:yes gene_type:complete
MTDKLIESFNTGSNVDIRYKHLLGDSHPCIVDISNCVNVQDMLINIENFRSSNYYSDYVDIITDFNKENTVKIENQSEEFMRGYFDLSNNDTVEYYCNLYIDGELIVQSNITAFSTYLLSDSNLKTDIYKIQHSLENIEKLRPVSFNWKHNNEYEVGFIAQELEEIFPGLVKEADYKIINENKLIPYLVDAIKNLKYRIKKIKNGNHK